MGRMKHFALLLLVAFSCASCKLGYVDVVGGHDTYSMQYIVKNMAWNLASAPVLAMESIDSSKYDIFKKGFSCMVAISGGATYNVMKIPGVENCWQVVSVTPQDKMTISAYVSMKESSVLGRNDWACRGQCVYTEQDGYGAEMNMNLCECAWKEELKYDAGSYVYKQTLLSTGKAEFRTYKEPEVLDTGTVSFSKCNVSQRDSFSAEIILK